MLNRKNPTLLLLALFVSILVMNLSGQDRSFATLPLVFNGSVTGDESSDLNHTSDYDRIVHVYNTLVQARGDYRYPVPTLFLRDVEGMVASMNADKNEITIEKKAYDVVKEFGDPGIAYLLAHELTHHYEKHAWKDFFLHDNKDLGTASKNIVNRLKNIQDGVMHETEADYLGGFLAYAAGYGLFKDGDQLISKLYNAYGLPDTLALYPSKTERIELAKRSADKMELLVDAFKVANYMFASGNVPMAYDYYGFILKQYQSREIYNNLGNIALLNAMSYMKDEDIQFKYVSELDLNMQGSKDVSRPVNEVIAEGLDQAILHFNAAINLDSDYAPAYLNKACAYILKGDIVRAQFYLEQDAARVAAAQPTKFKKTLDDLDILRAIIAAKTGNTSRAKDLLKALISKGNPMAKINLDILEGRATLSDFRSTTTEDLSDTEMMGDINLKSFINRPQFDQSKVVSINNKVTFFQFEPEGKNIKCYINQNDADRLRTVTIVTKAGYQGSTSKNLKIGDDAQKITEKYGTPIQQYETTEGQLIVFPGLVFITVHNKIEGWMVHKTKKVF